MNCIPSQLSHLIKKQNIEEMARIASKKELANFDMELTWVLINAPIKKSSEPYFDIAVGQIKRNSEIRPPSFMKHPAFEDITDTTMLERYECYISELDLYSYFSNNHTTSGFVKADMKRCVEIRYAIIEKINYFLVNAKGYSKACPECGKKLSLTYMHRLCNSCYNKSEYFDFDF